MKIVVESGVINQHQHKKQKLKTTHRGKRKKQQ